MFRFTRLFVMGLFMFTLPAVVSAQYTNVRVSNPMSTDPEEVTIAINPANPLNIAAGANITYYYYSMDGGYNWIEGNLFSSLGVWGDPAVTFDMDGNLYFAHLSWPNHTSNDWLDRIVVQKSTTGGITWSDGVGVGYNPPKDEDKEWIAVDRTFGPYHNNIYMAWTEFDNITNPAPGDSSRILFSRSTDHGVSWADPIRISDRAGNCADGDSTVEGAVPAVGPNGEIYLSWAGHELIYFDKSTDGGVTWGTDRVIATQPGGWDFTINGIYRCDGFPVTMCDVSWSPYRGHVYVVFSDKRNGVLDADVFFIKSTDGGVTWTTPETPVEEYVVRHQFFPWSTIDPVTGFIYIVFYDRRYTTRNATDVFVAMSEDGGANWTDFKVSESPFTPDPSVFFGDYINIAALNGKVYPIWMRMDSGDLSVWMAHVDIPVPSAIAFADQTLETRVRLSQNFPNPFNPVTRIEFEISRAMIVSVRIYDVSGRLVATVAERPFESGPHQVDWDGRDFNGQPVSSGVYFYKLSAGGQTVTRKMTLLK
jgi:hypothetical protein